MSQEGKFTTRKMVFLQFLPNPISMVFVGKTDFNRFISVGIDNVISCIVVASIMFRDGIFNKTARLSAARRET